MKKRFIDDEDESVSKNDYSRRAMAEAVKGIQNNELRKNYYYVLRRWMLMPQEKILFPMVETYENEMILRGMKY
ncbi:MAG TPA: hypothetical protein PKX37_10750 [Flexilinea sp.]|nr:hypothetical protein [Flexilinea sp.]